MDKTLLITSSPRGAASHSTTVATELAHSLGGDLIVRELWKHPVPPIGELTIRSMTIPEADQTEAQRASLAVSNELVDEILASDTIIIAAGMINYGMPANLKSWIDQITRLGRTVRYGENGPEGLLGDKRFILVLAAGGLYTHRGPGSERNHLEPALRTNLAFLGVNDPEVIWIEGTLHGEEQTASSLASALRHVERLVSRHRVAA